MTPSHVTNVSEIKLWWRFDNLGILIIKMVSSVKINKKFGKKNISYNILDMLIFNYYLNYYY